MASEQPVPVARNASARNRAGLALFGLAWVGVILLRLPYLLSPRYLLDGDEAILGLMAWHAAQGRELPVFFWGQSYGLSMLEVLPAALVFRVTGPSPIVLPLSMLALFLAAMPFYARAFQRLSGSVAWSRVLCLAMAAQPVWIIWSMKARGGYMTAFLLFGVLLWLLTRERQSWLGWAGAGFTAGLLFLAQPLWLVMSVPLLGLGVRRDARLRSARSWLRPLFALAVMVVTALVIRALWAPADPTWNPRVFEGFALARLISFPIELYRMFTGFFYLRWVQPAPLPVAIVAIAGAMLFFVCIALLLVQFRRTGRRSALFVALALIITIAPTVLLQSLVPRYLLQVSVLLIVGLAAWIGARDVRFAAGVRAIAIGAFIIVGLSSLETRHLRYHPTAVGDAETDLLGLIRTMQANDVKGIYSVSGLLQWQILFYGREAIPARFTYMDRRPEYLHQVNSARAAGAPTALVGQIPSTGATDLLNSRFRDQVVHLGERFFMVLDPPDDMLQSFGFTLLRP